MVGVSRNNKNKEGAGRTFFDLLKMEKLFRDARNQIYEIRSFLRPVDILLARLDYRIAETCALLTAGGAEPASDSDPDIETV